METALRSVCRVSTCVLVALLLGLGCQGDRCVCPDAGDTSIVLITQDGTFPYPTIQAAITAASDGDTVELANGTFTGAGNHDIDFLGKAITLRSARGDPELCVIDCQADSSNPRRGLIFPSCEGPQAVVKGITVANGYMMRGVDAPAKGGAVICYSSSPTFIRCVFSNNAAGEGGGLYCYANSEPEFVACAFSGNQADHGGAVYCMDSQRTEFRECVFSGNSAEQGGAVMCTNIEDLRFRSCTFIGGFGREGGGVCCWSCYVGFIDSRFISNSAGSTLSSGTGGGLSLVACFALVSRCEFEGNSAPAGRGGGMDVKDTNITLDRCAFLSNSAAVGGGAEVSASGEHRMVMDQCGFADNSAHHGGALSLIAQSSRSQISDCVFYRNETTMSGGAVSCWDTFGRFVGCLFERNQGGAGRGGGLFCHESAPVFEHSLFIENESQAGGGIYSEGSYLILTSCTFAYNSGTDHGAVLFCTESSLTECERCILAFSRQGEAVYCEDERSTPSFRCCDIYGNAGGDWIWPFAGQLGSSGNICKDPEFCGRAWPLTPYYLDFDSPCGPDSSSCGLMGAEPVGCR